MPTASIHADAILRAVMERHPETIAVFVRRRMHCPGCPMAPFMTLAEAAANYSLDVEELVGELRAAAASAATEVLP